MTVNAQDFCLQLLTKYKIQNLAFDPSSLQNRLPDV